MPQSLPRILIHLVFSTKNRERIHTPAIQTELHPYLAGVLDIIECPSLQVGGVEDHVSSASQLRMRSSPTSAIRRSVTKS